MPDHSRQKAIADALAHYRANDVRAAEKICRRILSHEPDNLDALKILGGCLYSLGTFDEAIQICRRVTSLSPNSAAAYRNLGGCLQRNEKWEEAAAAFKTAISLSPGFAMAYMNLALALVELNRETEALGCLRQAISLDSSLLEARIRFAKLLKKTGRLDEAIDVLRQLIARDPGSASAYSELGDVLLLRNQPAAALEPLQRAVQLKPDFLEAIVNLGICLHALKRFEEAVSVLQKAVDLNPQQSEAYNNLGVTLHAMGRFPQVVAAFERAKDLNPDFAAALSSLGLILPVVGRSEEAIACHQRAIEIQPSDKTFRWNSGATHLMLGHFERGWREYEYRPDLPQVVSKLDKLAPRWDGSDLMGKTILLATEQGRGDLIQFVRYLPLVAQTGATILLECPEDLRRLFHDLPFIKRLVLDGGEQPIFDCYCPLMSLAGIFGTTPQTIPGVPYLTASPDLVDAWRAKIGPPNSRLRVGIAWAGNPGHKNDHIRSIRFDQLAHLASAGRFDFHTLQKGPAAAQASQPPAGMELIDFSSDLTDFAETAALIQNLDLVICVDTAVAHLAGAMGKPVWILIPFEPDWRWMLNRSDSPWYPTMHLFRQTTQGNWNEVIDRVRHALAEYQP